ncbi:DNA N-glycosylase and apurinic/apyrimidinic (AP) lyase, partial [Chytriomyces hyalinus]
MLRKMKQIMQTRSKTSLLTAKAGLTTPRPPLKPKPFLQLNKHATTPSPLQEKNWMERLTPPSPPIAKASVPHNSSDPSEDEGSALTKRRPTTVRSRHELPPKNPPVNWEYVYDEIKLFRRMNPAHVDTLGCGILASPTLPPKVFRFQTFTALLLSSQTKDAANAAAIERLKTQLPGGLTIESVLEVDLKTLQSLIRGVSFHMKKAVYLKGAAQVLVDEFDSDVPKEVQEILNLPGIGPKMAHLAMQFCWGINDSGIGVDTHFHRIANKLGWVDTKIYDHEGTRK